MGLELPILNQPRPHEAFQSARELESKLRATVRGEVRFDPASRALYAVSTAFICKGDNGHWQPNYSFILGNFASAGISNLYYPSTDRNGAGLTISNALIDTASGAASSLLQEFLIKKISRGIPKNPIP